MLSNLLSTFYARDLRKLIEEVNLFQNEDDLWKIRGTARNGYVRNREEEFTKKGVPRQVLVAQLEQLIPLIQNTFTTL